MDNQNIGVSRTKFEVIKTCKKCGESKNGREFQKQSAAPDGLKNYCRECIRKINAKRYHENSEDIKDEVADWRAKNRDKVRGYQQKWRDANA